MQLGRDIPMRTRVAEDCGDGRLSQLLRAASDAGRLARGRALPVRRDDQRRLKAATPPGAALALDRKARHVGSEARFGEDAVDEADRRYGLDQPSERGGEQACLDIPAEGIEPDLARLERQGAPAEEIAGVVDDAQLAQ